MATWKCYYSNPVPDRTRPVSIVAMKIRERMEPLYVDRPKGMADHLFIHFYDPVEIWLNGSMTVLPPNSCVIWPPKTKHYFGHAARCWNHTWVHVVGAKSAAWLMYNGLPLEQPIPFRSGAIIEKYLWLMYDELHRHARPDDVILESLYSIWLREMARAAQTIAVGRPIPQRLLRAREHLEQNLAGKVTLPELAQIASLSVSQFSAVFKDYFGTSPIDYLLALRMRQSMYYLSDYNFNVTEIGRKVGFSDPFYFSKQFKRHFGMSPRHYRAKMSVRPSRSG
jgi:AraC family transcriptional regulator of arabinose operon